MEENSDLPSFSYLTKEDIETGKITYRSEITACIKCRAVAQPSKLKQGHVRFSHLRLVDEPDYLCPYCGSQSVILPAFTILKEGKHVVTLEFNNDVIHKFLALVQSSIQTNESKEVFLQEAAVISPSLGKTLRLFLEKDTPTNWLNSLWQFLTFLVLFHNTFIKEDETIKVLERLNQQLMQENIELRNTPPNELREDKQYDPACPCGSGELFNNCHGAKII